MSFDTIAYTNALEEFLTEMERIPSYIHQDIQPALANLASLLRIAVINSVVIEPPERGGSEPKVNSVVIYQGGPPDMSRKAEYSDTAGAKRNLYIAAQRMGEENWTDNEREKVELLLRMLYVFSSRISVMQEADYLSFHDKDTGIYNLGYLMKHVGQLIAQRKIGEYTAIYFNLKNFSSVNRLVGRNKGTLLMMAFISRVESIFTSENEKVARIGGDNFAVLFKKEHLDAVLDVLKGTGIEYNSETGESVLISATAGVYDIMPSEIRSPSDIMDKTSVAVSIARNVEKVPFAFYDAKMAEQLRQSKEIEDMFPEALENEEFQVYYQPKVSLRNYRLAGAEALCRWFHEGQMIMPFRFIPVLEQTQAISALDFYMLEHVCMDIRKWLDEGRPAVKVSVNLSRRHLGDMNLLEHILKIIDRHNVPHKYIEIELTETTTDVDFKELKEIVTGLQKNGVSTSVDDFGMGYSSLNLIRELPWDVLKIDKSFIDENDDQKDKHAKIMLKHTISMAQEIGMECIVEGVETPEQIRLLKENNCFLAQGYFFDKPLPKSIFETRLDELK